MEEIRITCDTLRVTFRSMSFQRVLCEKIRFHVNIEDRTKEEGFSFAYITTDREK